eukprot:1159219_1
MGEDSSIPNRLYDTGRLKGNSSTSKLVAISKSLDASSCNSSLLNHTKRRKLKESSNIDRGISKEKLFNKTKKSKSHEADFKDRGS